MNVEGIREIEERWKKENMLELVHRVLSRTIKRDDHVKLITFLTALSAYSDSPINLFLKGESGSGKSYITREVLKLFPESDVSFLAMLSPKAFAHETGTPMIDGKPAILLEKPAKPSKKEFRNPEDYEEAKSRYEQEMLEYIEKQKRMYWYTNLSRKIIAFLEIPDPETFRNLYPLLSHDKERIEYKFVDKTERGMMITRRVVVEGWPATIFCTTDRKYVEELATRSLTITPDTSPEKIKDAMALITDKASSLFDESDSPDVIFLKRVIEHIKTLFQEYRVIIPFHRMEQIFPKNLVRHMRDYDHFVSMIKTTAMLYFPQREIVEINGKKYILANIDDVLTVYQLYMRIKEITETGTSENIIRFYYDIVATKDRWTVKELLDAYKNKYVGRVGSQTIRKWLERLDELGYVVSEDDPNDRRVKIWIPQNPAKMLDNQEDLISLASVLRDQREEWLENIRYKMGGCTRRKLGGTEVGKPHISLSIYPPTSRLIFSGKSPEPSQENKPEEISSPKNLTSPSVSGLPIENLKNSETGYFAEKTQEKGDQNKPEEARFSGNLTSPQPSQDIHNNKKEWEELNKRLLEYAKRARESGPLPACKYCAFWQGDENSWLGKCIKTDSITNREYSCEKYVWKNEVMKRKEAVEEMVHKSTYYEKIKELGNGWTAYGLPAGKDYRCSVCGEKAFVKIMRYVNGEKEEKMLCSSCFSLLKKEGGVS